MNIITIMGSPNKKGKTATALEMAEKNLISNGHEVERINVTDYKINGCLGCYACMASNDKPGCIQKDDAQSIFEKMISADTIVYASPLYCFDFTSQIKPLIDRQLCFINTKLMDGKHTALLITCAGKIERNADLVQEIFRRSFDKEIGMVHTDIVGEYVIPFSNEPDFNERAQKVATSLASAITK
jgi:Multimeric flavodoxin WrbA